VRFVVRKEGGTMLLARWEADIERVIVERVDGSGRVLGYHRMTRDEFSEFLNQAEVVCDETCRRSCGCRTAAPAWTWSSATTPASSAASGNSGGSDHAVLAVAPA
jgi:hypothetical protein